MKVGYVYDPIYLKHNTGQHVENANRLEAIVSHLEQTGLKRQLSLVKPRAASTEELLLVHDKGYISHIQDVAQKGGGWLDADTVMSPDSYEAALYAAGGVIRAVEAKLLRLQRVRSAVSTRITVTHILRLTPILITAVRAERLWMNRAII